MSKVLIAFKTHVNSNEFKKNLEKILSDVKNLKNHDFVVLNDNTNNTLDITDVPIINFNKETIISNKNGYDFWYRADVPMIFLNQELTNYDYYYQIEFDCYCDDWKTFFEKLYEDNSDMLATWVKDTKKEPHWGWWSSHNLIIDECKLLGTYFPIVRFSKHSLNVLDTYYREGYEGFCEIICSSILNKENMKITDIGNILGYYQIIHKTEDLIRYKR